MRPVADKLKLELQRSSAADFGIAVQRRMVKTQGRREMKNRLASSLA
jgi:hypothetical protein